MKHTIARTCRIFTIAGVLAAATTALGCTVPSTVMSHSMNARERLSHVAMKKITVMTVGGSSAYGDDDPRHNSYLNRGFLTYSQTTQIVYRIVNHTAIGGTPNGIDVPGKYKTWLAQTHPQVVVMSWGLLDDINRKTPVGKFVAAIKDEILAALQAHAVVVFVTPPVVDASATYDYSIFTDYLNLESQVAHAFSGNQVYWLDLNKDMTAYLANHHETWSLYAGDSWHPNQAGHELAGQLLAQELLETFGSTPITLTPGYWND